MWKRMSTLLACIGLLFLAGCGGGNPAPAATASPITEFALPTPKASLDGITAGPDGNLWFTEGAGKIGRMTPAGQITEFALPASDSNPVGITAGPDGNLWFTELGANKIGRLTPPR